MLNAFFASKLADLGYPNQQISHVLDYRLGDGVAFFGHIGREQILRLANRLLCEQGRRDFASNRAVIRKAVRLGVSFEIFKLEVTAPEHVNNMYVRCHVPEGVTLTPYQKSVVEVFVALLREDVMATSEILTTVGYALLTATPHEPLIRRVMVRGDFVVLVKELPQPDFNVFEKFGPTDGKIISEAMALNLMRHYGLQVEIRPKAGGPALGEARVWGLIEDAYEGADLGVYRANVRLAMRDAVAEARRELQRRSLRAA